METSCSTNGLEPDLPLECAVVQTFDKYFLTDNGYAIVLLSTVRYMEELAARLGQLSNLCHLGTPTKAVSPQMVGRGHCPVI